MLKGQWSGNTSKLLYFENIFKYKSLNQSTKLGVTTRSQRCIGSENLERMMGYARIWSL